MCRLTSGRLGGILERTMNKGALENALAASAGRRISALSRVPLGHAGADAALGGLAQGALHEVYAGGAGQSAAATGFALALAVRVSQQRPLLWVRQDFAAHEYGELYAPGLLELGLDPARLILVRVAQALDVLRVAAEALTCSGLGAVVAEIPGAPKILDLTASRRLVLAAANKDVTAVLLRLDAKPAASAAETRWLVHAARSRHEDDWDAPRFHVALTRNRHGDTGTWVMEWCDGCFREPVEAVSSDLVAAPAGEPHRAPGEERRA